MLTVFAGGVGASRFLQGLIRAVDPREVTVISNTGDDVEMFGVHVSPDTDICIYALKQNQVVLKNLLAHERADVAVSVITEAELRTGAARSGAAARIGRLVENFLRPLTILDFVSADAATYAQIRARLERPGRPIGPLDTLIAAQAVARKLTLVSNNRKEFGRVPRLAIENWADRA